MKKFVFLGILMTILFSSCGEYNKILKSTDYELKYSYAKKYFNKKDYAKAATLLDELVTIFKGTAYAEESLYLLAHDNWKVKEVDIPKDYTVIYRSNETQYVIVNTHKDFDDSEQPPATETSTTSTNSSLTETTTVSSLKTEDSDLPETSTSSSEKLPQTGQLWWPVPLLAGGGILFIAIGLRIRSRKENEK